MKKKILSLLMVFAFGFTIAGCDATMEDVKNQASKMQEIIDEEIIPTMLEVIDKEVYDVYKPNKNTKKTAD